MHPDLARLARLVGTWTGTGHGDYPTIEPFDYRETVRFDQRGDKPFLAYAQQTAHAVDGRPLHIETGYLRPAGADRAELVVVQPTGIVEVDEGELHEGPDGTLDLVLRSVHVARTTTAKEVTAVERRLHLMDDVLRTTLDMAAVGQPLHRHLAAELRRADEPGQADRGR